MLLGKTVVFVLKMLPAKKAVVHHHQAVVGQQVIVVAPATLVVSVRKPMVLAVPTAHAGKAVLKTRTALEALQPKASLENQVSACLTTKRKENLISDWQVEFRGLRLEVRR